VYTYNAFLLYVILYKNNKNKEEHSYKVTGEHIHIMYSNSDDSEQVEPSVCFTCEGLSLAYHTIDDIPIKILQSPLTKTCKRIDLTECGIKNLDKLSFFPSLEVLVLDKNELQRLDTLPRLERLHTLWCNNNHISDLPSFIDDLSRSCPKLSYLSIMRNPACPGLMDIVHPDVESIRLYRSYVIYRIPRLVMLDSEMITQQEFEHAKVRGQYAMKRTIACQHLRPLTE